MPGASLELLFGFNSFTQSCHVSYRFPHGTFFCHHPLQGNGWNHYRAQATSIVGFDVLGESRISTRFTEDSRSPRGSRGYRTEVILNHGNCPPIEKILITESSFRRNSYIRHQYLIDLRRVHGLRLEISRRPLLTSVSRLVLGYSDRPLADLAVPNVRYCEETLEIRWFPRLCNGPQLSNSRIMTPLVCRRSQEYSV